MNIDFLTMMAYLIVAITIITMIFGVIAYSVYKIREKRRATKQQIIQDENLLTYDTSKRYLFFEQKEILV